MAAVVAGAMVLSAGHANAVDILLSGRDLSGAVFSAADLTGADLTGADLTGADLTEAKLQDDTIRYRAVFTGANLTRVEINGLLGGKERTLAARFDSAYLQDAKIDANELFGVDFTAATLISCGFVSAKSLVGSDRSAGSSCAK